MTFVTEEKARQIKIAKNAGTSNAELATQFGIHPHHVSAIVTGKIFKDVAPELTITARSKASAGAGSIGKRYNKYRACYANKYIGMYSSVAIAKKAVELYRTTGEKMPDVEIAELTRRKMKQGLRKLSKMLSLDDLASAFGVDTITVESWMEK